MPKGCEEDDEPTAAEELVFGSDDVADTDVMVEEDGGEPELVELESAEGAAAKEA